MTDTAISADIITLRKPDDAKREAARLRQRACRARKKATKLPSTKVTSSVAEIAAVTKVTKPVTKMVTDRVTASHQAFAPILLQGAAAGLALVGITMNGWFARSLGSSDVAGWLFLGVGVAADACALALPTCAALQWRARQRGAAAAGWLVWIATLAFALTAGIGFASVNISDVTSARASHVTLAVTEAQASLKDTMITRDKECAGGVGKFCRQREEAVASARANLERVLQGLEQSSDPQIAAATKMVTWVSLGVIQPKENDFAMLRLVLIALLPQLGGILLMVSRPPKR